MKKIKRIIVFSMVLGILLLFFSNAIAAAPFSLRGVSFGMTEEEVVNILGEYSKKEKENDLVQLEYYFDFSKFHNADFYCILSDNSVRALMYEKEIDADDYTYIIGALSQKYGSEDDIIEEAISRLSQIYNKKMEIPSSISMNAWEYSDVYILVLYVANRSIDVIYMESQEPDTYNTFGL